MNQASLGDYREEAASLVVSGQYAAARRVAEHMLRHYPEYIEGRHLLGRVLLGTGSLLDAATQFSWVLSCDPECVGARLGLARVHQALGNADIAQTHLARAFDLFPGDADLRREMNDLLDSDTRIAVEQHEMTRAALARIYARNGLVDKAIQEFEAVLQQEPDRHDVLLSLAETLWRDGRQVEAVTVCHRVLDALPNALKANLIVGAAWLTSPQPEEAQPYLAIAQALDPEHTLAEMLFGAQSPFPTLTPMIERLAEPTIAVSGPSAHALADQAELPADRELDFNGEETTPMSEQSRPEEDFEIPDWLQGVGDELLAEDGAPAHPPGISPSGDETPDWLRALVSRADDAAPEDVGAGAGEDSLSMRGPASDAAAEVFPMEPEAAGLPEWLQRIAGGEATAAPEPTVPTPEPAATDAEMADWISQLSAMRTEAAAAVDDRAPGDLPPAAGGADFTVPDVEVEETDLPDWLRDTPAPSVSSEVTAPTAELPDWLREEERAEPQEPMTTSSGQLPDWLKAVAAGTPVAQAYEAPAETGPVAVTPGPVESAPVDELPDWLKDTAADVDTVEAIEHPAPSSAPAAPGPADELPDWLRPVAEGGVAPEDQYEPAQPGSSAWLTEDTMPAEPTPLTEPEPGGVPPEAEATLPDWLRELQEPRTQPAPGPAVPVGMADLEDRAEVSEVSDADLPDWLRRLRTGVADEAPPLGTRELEADLAALSIVGTTAGEPAPEDLLPPEALPATPEVTETVFEPPPPEPVAEVTVPLPEPEERPTIDEGAAALEELAAIVAGVEEQPAPALPVAEVPIAVAAKPVTVSVDVEMAPPPVEEAATAELPAPAPEPEVIMPPIEDPPRDAAERLTLARAAATSSWSQALPVYQSLVGSADLLSTVITDLEEGIRKHPDEYAGYQLVGDAYMKDGRLPEALRAYRTALTKLQR